MHHISYINLQIYIHSLQNRSSRPDVLSKNKVFLKILQNAQENTYARASFLIKLQLH